MKIKCIKELPDRDDEKILGVYYYPGQQNFGLIEGKEYIVYAISILGGEVWVFIDEEERYIYPAPLCLFEIIDNRVSRYWELRIKEESILLWPPSFFKGAYHERLADGDDEIVANFTKVNKLIREEI